MDEKVKDEIVKKVLEELKNKKLLNTSKSSYKSTEKLLYSLNVLPEAIKLIDEEVRQLEEEIQGISIPTTKSNSLVLKEGKNTYVYGDETLEARVSELKQISIKAKSQIRLVKNSLKKIETDKYYDIIPFYYFSKMTIEQIAEECSWAVGTVYNHKKRLMNELKVYIFPNNFLDEL